MPEEKKDGTGTGANQYEFNPNTDWTVDEWCAQKRLSRATGYKYIKRGWLEATQYGGLTRITPEQRAEFNRRAADGEFVDAKAKQRAQDKARKAGRESVRKRAEKKEASANLSTVAA